MARAEHAGTLSRLRVAIVHDWLTGMRGGEKVLEAILGIFPRADIFTLFHFEGSVSKPIESHRIITSSLQRAARLVPNYRYLLPLLPRAVEAWDFSSYDLVVSSSHCVAKGAKTGDVPHVSYCHTPMRYIWDRFDDYFPPSRPLQRFAATTIAPALRRWDVRSASRVTRFIANSSFVRGRIAEYYEREAELVHPFVDDEFLDAPLSPGREDWHVVVSALVPYKKIGKAVEAAQRAGQRLVVVGNGPERRSLERRYGTSAEFRGWVEPEELRELVGRARSLIIPGIEDFGITALEAMALGTPVVAPDLGGVRDSVVHGTTGLLYDGDDDDGLVEALIEAGGLEWDRAALRRRAREFDRTVFVDGMSRILTEVVT